MRKIRILSENLFQSHNLDGVTIYKVYITDSGGLLQQPTFWTMVFIVAKFLTTSFKNISATRIIMIQSRICKWYCMVCIFHQFVVVQMDGSEMGNSVRHRRPNCCSKEAPFDSKDDETYGMFHYPKLRVVSQDFRDPCGDFDWHYHLRNFGEMVRLFRFMNWIIFPTIHKLWHL